MSLTIREPGAAPAVASAAGRIRHLFVRDLVLDALIGIHAHEQLTTQRVRINLDLAVEEGGPALRLSDVVSYEPLVAEAKRIVAAGHIALVETLAERLADLCLADPRVTLARIRVEKLDIIPEAASVGVEIERRRA